MGLAVPPAFVLRNAEAGSYPDDLDQQLPRTRLRQGRRPFLGAGRGRCRGIVRRAVRHGARRRRRPPAPSGHRPVRGLGRRRPRPAVPAGPGRCSCRGHERRRATHGRCPCGGRGLHGGPGERPARPPGHRCGRRARRSPREWRGDARPLRRGHRRRGGSSAARGLGGAVERCRDRGHRRPGAGRGGTRGPSARPGVGDRLIGRAVLVAGEAHHHAARRPERVRHDPAASRRRADDQQRQRDDARCGVPVDDVVHRIGDRLRPPAPADVGRCPRPHRPETGRSPRRRTATSSST